MAGFIDHTGKKFGRWTVARRSESNISGRPAWDCVCDCGAEKSVMSKCLSDGSSRSCGCHRTDRLTGHGLKGSYQYQAWVDMRRRCYNEKCKGYPDYGGRGIRVYYRWKDDPVAFCEWLDRFLGPRPEGHSLDRINNDGDYEPRNLRWADRSTQNKNRKRRSK